MPRCRQAALRLRRHQLARISSYASSLLSVGGGQSCSGRSSRCRERLFVRKRFVCIHSTWYSVHLHGTATRLASFAVWVEEQDPFVPTYAESFACNRLAVADALNQRVSGDCVLVFASDGPNRCSRRGHGRSRVDVLLLLLLLFLLLLLLYRRDCSSGGSSMHWRRSGDSVCIRIHFKTCTWVRIWWWCRVQALLLLVELLSVLLLLVVMLLLLWSVVMKMAVSLLLVACRCCRRRRACFTQLSSGCMHCSAHRWHV